MIKVEDPGILGEKCICCCSTEGTMAIIFKNGERNNVAGSGTAISLCGKCRKELMTKLTEETEE